MTIVVQSGVLRTQTVNLLLKSQALDDAAWTKAGLSITANDGTAPDSTSTADTVHNDSAGTDLYFYQAPAGAGPATYTLSFYAKTTGSVQFIAASIGENGVANHYAWFDVTNRTVGTTESGVTASVTVVEGAGGWNRYIMHYTLAAGNVNALFEFVSADGGHTSAGNGTTVLLWGFQEEVGSSATTYSPNL